MARGLPSACISPRLWVGKAGRCSQGPQAWPSLARLHPVIMGGSAVSNGFQRYQQVTGTSDCRTNGLWTGG